MKKLIKKLMGFYPIILGIRTNLRTLVSNAVEIKSSLSELVSIARDLEELKKQQHEEVAKNLMYPSSLSQVCEITPSLTEDQYANKSYDAEGDKLHDELLATKKRLEKEGKWVEGEDRLAVTSYLIKEAFTKNSYFSVLQIIKEIEGLRSVNDNKEFSTCLDTLDRSLRMLKRYL